MLLFPTFINVIQTGLLWASKPSFRMRGGNFLIVPSINVTSDITWIEQIQQIFLLVGCFCGIFLCVWSFHVVCIVCGGFRMYEIFSLVCVLVCYCVVCLSGGFHVCVVCFYCVCIVWVEVFVWQKNWTNIYCFVRSKLMC